MSIKTARWAWAVLAAAQAATAIYAATGRDWLGAVFFLAWALLSAFLSGFAVAEYRPSPAVVRGDRGQQERQP